MSLATWIPLFVVADLSIDVLNHVLESAEEVQKVDEVFENRWVLIQHSKQETLSRPTKPGVKPFETGFLGTCLEELQTWVEANCGENGLGSIPSINMDWLADDAFGVVDERTALDNTILFCAREYVDAVQEAEVRVAWNKGSERDNALIMYLDPTKNADGDLRRLIESFTDEQGSPKRDAPGYQEFRARLEDWEEEESGRQAQKWFNVSSGVENTSGHSDIEELKDKLDDWVVEQQAQVAPRWFELRLDLAGAISSTYGIMHVCPSSMLTERRDIDFDENGVMK